MKKFTHIFALLAVVALPLVFTSCDDDDDPWWWGYHDGDWGYNDPGRDDPGYDQNDPLVDEAQVLNGEWDGQMIYHNGTDGTIDQFYANMTFVQNSTYATRGTGTEYDYYLNDDGSTGDSQLLTFTWYIDDNGDIYVKYASGSTFVMDLDAKQHGFELKEAQGIFRGYMIGTNNSDLIQFDFTRKTSNAKASWGSAATAPMITSFGQDGMPTIAPTTKMSLPKGRR